MGNDYINHEFRSAQKQQDELKVQLKAQKEQLEAQGDRLNQILSLLQEGKNPMAK